MLPSIVLSSYQRHPEGTCPPCSPPHLVKAIEHVASGNLKYLASMDEIARFVRPYLETMGVRFRKLKEHKCELKTQEGTGRY
jgi:hypothetical protein